jgi:hypothetical protein
MEEHSFREHICGIFSIRADVNITAGCLKRLSSKAAASEGPEAYPLWYVEGLNDARTLLADFFSILPERNGGA